MQFRVIPKAYMIFWRNFYRSADIFSTWDLICYVLNLTNEQRRACYAIGRVILNLEIQYLFYAFVFQTSFNQIKTCKQKHVKWLLRKVKVYNNNKKNKKNPKKSANISIKNFYIMFG